MDAEERLFLQEFKRSLDNLSALIATRTEMKTPPEILPTSITPSAKMTSAEKISVSPPLETLPIEPPLTETPRIMTPTVGAIATITENSVYLPLDFSVRAAAENIENIENAENTENDENTENAENAENAASSSVKPPMATVRTQTFPHPNKTSIKAPNKAPKKSPSVPSIEDRTNALMEKIKNWICVGEEFRRPDVPAEYAVATTWLIRGGIAVLLFGIGFFVKYSIDNGWLSPIMRIVAAQLLGVAMIGGGLWAIAHKPLYRALALGILGGGFATLYLATFGGYRLYELVNLPTAFGLFILITAAAMGVSMRINALLPAMIGCIAGYATPILLSNNSGNLPALFAYMIILAVGILWVARRQAWTLLTGTAFLLSMLVTAGALQRYLSSENYLYALGFLAVNFLIFAIIPQIQRAAPTIFDLTLTILNFMFYIVIALPIAEKYAADYYGGALAALFAAAAAFGQTHWRRNSRSLMITWLCGAVFALATSLPLLFGGKWTVTAWSALAVALLLIYVRLRIKALAVLSGCAFIASFCVLLGQARNLTFYETYPPAAWERFWWCGVYLLALGSGAEILRRARATLPQARSAYAGMFIAAGAGWFFYSTYEVSTALGEYLETFQSGGVSLWWAVLAFTALYGGLRRGQKSLRIIGLSLFAVCVGKVFLIDLANSSALAKIVAFVVLGIILLVGATAYIRLFKEKK